MRDRVRFHLEHGARYVQALVNHGREAGASLDHPHGQLVPLDLVPPAVRTSSTGSSTPDADPVETEAEAAGAAGLDVVAGPAALWCPHAGVTPFELRVAHRGRATRFDEASDDEIAASRPPPATGLRRLAAVLGDVPYNLVVALRASRHRLPLVDRGADPRGARRRIRDRDRHLRERHAARARGARQLREAAGT